MSVSFKKRMKATKKCWLNISCLKATKENAHFRDVLETNMDLRLEK